MARTLVTGGAGFIGSHIATKLVELGHHVRVFDDLSSGKRSNLAHLGDRVEFIQSDMRDAQACLDACEGIEFVFHEAALPSVPKSIDQPVPSHEANINGTFNFLMAARQQEVRRFIYAGSSSAYGDSEISPKHEGLPPAPLSPYAVQKLTGEHYASAFHHAWGLQTLTIRYFNVFGARQDPDSAYAAAIPAFVSNILKGEAPTVFGDGEQTRDFTHVDNVVHGNMLAMQAARTCGEVVNVACGGQITINQVIAEINRMLGTDVRPKYVSPRPGDILHSCADISRAKKVLGYTPLLNFGEGLERTIEYYKSLPA
ncbi:MAG: SDR family oxidoreductase [Phycisphaerae bacterium]